MSNAPLTLRDIDQICEAFGTVMNGVFHERIEYPKVDIPQRVRKLDTEADPSDAAQDAETKNADEMKVVKKESAENKPESAKDDAVTPSVQITTHDDQTEDAEA